MKDRFPIAQWPELFDGVWKRNAILNRMIAEIAYGNVRFAFDLARAKTLGDVLQLQAEYWRNLFNIVQGKEYRDAFFGLNWASSREGAAASPRAESPRAEGPRTESVKAESAKTESVKTESVKAESAKPESPRIAESPVIAPEAAMPERAVSIVAPPPAKTPRQRAEPEPKRTAATRAAKSEMKSEKPQSRPERHRPEPRGARKAAAPRRQQAPQEAVAPGGRGEIRFVRLDDTAVRFTAKEAWRLRNGTWRKVPAAKVAEEAVVLSKTRFDQLFPKVPKLPAGAFKPKRD